MYLVTLVEDSDKQKLIYKRLVIKEFNNYIIHILPILDSY